jgi:hypothetical protein
MANSTLSACDDIWRRGKLVMYRKELDISVLMNILKFHSRLYIDSHRNKYHGGD